jgi:hypothetical protein
LWVAAAGSAMATGVWDLSGGIGINAGRADNPRFLGRLRAVCDKANPTTFDPNNPLCDPNSPTFDPSTTSVSRQAESYGSLRLTGTLAGKWETTDFNVSYSPVYTAYFGKSSLNQLGHNLNSSWQHKYSPRTSLDLDEYFNYTPEQDLDPNNLDVNALLTRRTSHTNNNFKGDLEFKKSTVTTLNWTYRYVLRGFSSSDYIDSMNHEAGFQWKRRVGRYNFVSAGYEYAVYIFERNVPGSDRHVATVGYGYASQQGFNLNLNVGYNVLLPDDPNEPNVTGTYTNSSIGWSGKKVAAAGGYTRDISGGGGAYANARSQGAYGSLRLTYTPKLTTDLTATYNVQERISGVTVVTAATTSETIRSFNGRATLNYQMTKDVGLNASYTRYRQSVPGLSGGAVPEVRSANYSLGMTWSFH